MDSLNHKQFANSLILQHKTINNNMLTEQELEKLRYPIGPYETPAAITPEMIQGYIRDIETLPGKLRMAVAGLTEAQLETPYRPGGWTVRQLVHHFADSHMNGLTRLKLALTENEPTIKPYDETPWVNLADARLGDIALSLQLVEALHARWVLVWKSLQPADFERGYIHPQMNQRISVAENAATYAWHSNHHLAHITTLREREGW